MGDDKNENVQDMGMGVAMESRFADMRENNGTVIGEIAAGVNRPISYAVVPQDLDPVGDDGLLRLQDLPPALPAG